MPYFPPTLSEIVDATARAAKVPRDVLLGPQTRKPLPAFRHAGMAYAYADGRWSCIEIGYAFNRDHTTVLYAVRRRAFVDAETAAVLAELSGVRHG